MRIADFVLRDAVIPELTGSSKEGVIREMVESLRSAGYCKGGIGRGVAIPHTKHNSVDRLVGTVALSKAGVPFDSLDGEPVHVFVLLISPQDRPGDHLRALENVSRCLRDDGFVKSLRACKTREDVWALLDKADGRPG